MGPLAPASLPPSAPERLVTRHTLAEAKAASRPRILLAEDNEVNQQVAVGLIEKLGYRIDVVPNGREAVAAFGRIAYDLVLMDCQMPEMDGFEATQVIRDRENGGRRVPIVAMTANAMQGDRERCLAVGMNDHLTKPVNRAKLEQVLQRWIAAGQESVAQPEGADPSHENGVASESPPIDLEVLRSIVGDDREALFRYFDIFRVSTAELLVQAGTAVLQQDQQALARAAHTLRGSCGSIGAIEMARLSAEIEAAAHRARWPLAEELHQRLTASFDQATAFTATV
jgi:CheY-like chemotaxis protein/HPt (histidine-containing phosphotransfer) domain-containing protein